VLAATAIPARTPDLERYVHRHPRDAMGFYELAIAQAYVDRSKPLSARPALTLDPC